MNNLHSTLRRLTHFSSYICDFIVKPLYFSHSFVPYISFMHSKEFIYYFFFISLSECLFLIIFYLFLVTALLDCSLFICTCFLFTHPHLKVSLFHLLFIPLICNLCSSYAYDISNVLPTLPVLLLFPSILLKRIFILTILKFHYVCLRNFLLNFHDPFPRLLPLI